MYRPQLVTATAEGAARGREGANGREGGWSTRQVDGVFRERRNRSKVYTQPNPYTNKRRRTPTLTSCRVSRILVILANPCERDGANAKTASARASNAMSALKIIRTRAHSTAPLARRAGHVRSLTLSPATYLAALEFLGCWTLDVAVSTILAEKAAAFSSTRVNGCRC